VQRRQFGALVEATRLADRPAVLAKPQGFMNLSGQPAASLRGFYKVADDDMIVVHDDVDLAFGDVRLKQGGGHGGHNGLRDLLDKLGTASFVRVRVGVGRPPEGWDTADWVLGAWTQAESAELPSVLDRASDAVEAVVREGVAPAMNHTNRADRGARAAGRTA
jgi:PTH1 family peptidyl-tRNA hydrolase